jgi:hypothetical protein
MNEGQMFTGISVVILIREREMNFNTKYGDSFNFQKKKI